MQKSYQQKSAITEKHTILPYKSNGFPPKDLPFQKRYPPKSTSTKAAELDNIKSTHHKSTADPYEKSPQQHYKMLHISQDMRIILQEQK